jgi:hypothetical protein
VEKFFEKPSPQIITVTDDKALKELAVELNLVRVQNKDLQEQLDFLNKFQED